MVVSSWACRAITRCTAVRNSSSLMLPSFARSTLRLDPRDDLVELVGPGLGEISK